MSGRLSKVVNWEDVAKQAGFIPATMADLCFVSLRQLERFFDERFHTTPTKWIRDYRCRLAVAMIAQGWSSKAVARELKYADESHFCHEFRKARGTTPQNFAPTYRPNLDVAFRQECRF